MVLIVLLYALLAATFVIAKFALNGNGPIFLIGFRMTLAGILLLSYLLFFKRSALKIKREDLLLFLRVAFFHVYFAFVFEFWALQYMSSSKTNLIYSLTPFIAATLSYFFLKEKLSKRKVFGLVLGIAGITPIIILQAPSGDASLALFNITLPEIVLLVAVASASYAWFDIKKLMSKGYSLLLINGSAMLVGGLGAFITSYIKEGFSPPPVVDFGNFLKFVLVLIVLSNVIFYNMYGSLLKKYSITFLTFAGFLCPLFGIFFGWLFRDETITWHYWVSLSAITMALFIFYKEERKKPIDA